MAMASRILPSFFCRRRSAGADGVVPAATPEELLELEMRLWDVAPAAAYELQKRRHWTPEMVAREAEKQRWIAEQKRLIAKEAKRRRRGKNSGDASIVDVFDGSVSLDKVLGEEFERRRFFEALRLQAEARRAASESAATATVDSRCPDSSNVDHPIAVTEDDDVPSRGDESYLERRRELLGCYRLTPVAGTR